MDAIPEFLTEYLAPALLIPVTEGMSHARVWRVEVSGLVEYYLKSVPQDDDQELRREAERLAWFSSRVATPTVCAFGQEADYSHLLTTAVTGKSLADFLTGSDAITIVKGVGTELQRLHSIPVAECPFDMQLAQRLALAEVRVKAGEVDLENFDDERRGQNANVLWAEVLAKQPAFEDLTVTHGDFCPPNVLINPDTLEVSGFIDWGRAGIADRYQDLTLILRELEPELHVPFLEGYGTIQNPDMDKVAYYQLVDEFF